MMDGGVLGVLAEYIGIDKSEYKISKCQKPSVKHFFYCLIDCSYAGHR